MTTTVVTATLTRTVRREPLKVIDMAASQGRPASSSSARVNGEKGRGTRASSRLNAKDDGHDESAAAQKSAQGRPTRNASKRNAAEYDEDIGGFQFSRATIKKLKSAPAVNEDTIDKPVIHSPRRGRPPKSQTFQSVEDATLEVARASTRTTKATRGRQKRVSLESEVEIPKQQTRKRDDEPPFPIEKPAKTGRPPKRKSVDISLQSPELSQGATSTIALPVADTPVIRRNKEMREGRGGKGQRRNSLGMRGRRASSLIDSGASNALPHKEVPTSEFYKHIASDGLPEPRRMRQLMTWCATRALDDKPSGSRSDDDSARLAARVIQEELLQDFSNKSELTNWFAREDAPAPAVIVKKPNPKNVQNAEKIKELEEQIRKLQNERHALNALLRPPPIPALDSPPREQTTKDNAASKNISVIDESILDPSQRSIMTALAPEGLRIHREGGSSEEKLLPTSTTTPPLPPAAVSRRLSRITSSLAPTLDAFASGLHDIDIYRSTADRLSHQVLKFCSERLEERDNQIASRNGILESDTQGKENAYKDDDSKGSRKMALRTRQARQQKEDISLILGALSRVERR
ncbi:Mis12-Mtw1 family protein [Talaromyces stipitatus ATCC 10500]|uniref:Mis12-Mtw1 family protein n=1 Tax=Talaromyces stipitatus (strain ATCC 10500 / CBS 375.48 / QM 6759 / NRRL 1006) TaxID=441959 RepID=B8M4X0_TALSN|nr:Mis12-Mtw1 family protein [Talaromyces stipitatus ATCC 10500]EED19405.1 Mis12-Mtw1 family protein [Talaromyces stipitatus ATCC 10500]